MFQTLYSVFIVLFVVASVNAQAKTIVLGYPEFKPYTYTEKGQAKGQGIAVARQLFSELYIEVEFSPTDNYGSALTFLKNGRIDGFLLASQNEQRDAIAVFSQPITSNNWSWFTTIRQPPVLLNNLDKKTFRVTTHKNANTHVWLETQGFQAVYPTTDLHAMLRQLMHSRVDAIFIAEAVLLDSIKHSSWKISDFNITVQKSKPFGLYIGKQYLRQHPDLMDEVNKQISLLTEH